MVEDDTRHSGRHEVPASAADAGERLDRFLAQGLDREQIRAAFVKEFGDQSVLTAPLDQGFNRLAWLLPYLFGIAGAAGAGLVAFRWSRTSGTLPAPAGMAVPEDSEGRARLDDELRNLD